MSDVMGIGIPAPFLQSPGEPPMPWSDWKKAFQTFLTASGYSGENWPAARLIALLVHCLGSEGQRIYHSIYRSPSGEDTDTLDGTLDLLEKQFARKENEVAARARFRDRRQNPGERTGIWVADLHRLVVPCKYRDSREEEENIRDQIVEKTANPRIRERLLTEDGLTLEKAISIAAHCEQVAADARALSKLSGATGASGNGTTVNRIGFQGKPKQAKQGGLRAQGKAPGRTAAGENCFNCGKPGHFKRSPTCPARNVQCRSCGRKGHFEACCRSRGIGAAIRQLQDGVEEPAILAARTGNQGKDVRVALWFGPKGRTPAVRVRMIVDTGCHTTVIPRPVYDALLADVPLEESTLTARLYGKERLPIAGEIVVRARYKAKTVLTRILVANIDGDEQCLLGMNLFNALNMRIMDYEGEAIGSVTIDSIRDRYPGLFSEKVRSLKGFTHRIVLKEGAVPFVSRLRQPPKALEEKGIDALKKMHSDGLIEKVESAEWILPALFVAKPNGEARVVQDMRPLNVNVVPAKYPTPTIEEMLAKIGGATVFSVVDLKQAYYQIPLTEDCKHLTAFITPIGLFQNTALPMGYVSSGAVFQQAMTIILAGIPGVICLMDDILVFGKAQEEHDDILHQVLKRLDKHNATVEPRKMVLSQASVKFNGHIFSKDGVKPIESNVAAIVNMPKPEKVREMEMFLGMLTYYARFCAHFSTLCEPLRAGIKELTKGNEVPWNPEMDKAFEAVKGFLSAEPILGLYKRDCPTIVTTDASDVGLGAALSQIQEGIEVVIAYASRTLTKAERNYSVLEREGLAVVWALERWKYYVWGFPVTVRTDQQALVSLFNTSYGQKGQKPARIARWYLRLAEFDYRVEHKPGKENLIADTLSRLPVHASEKVSDEWADYFVACIRSSWALSKEELSEETESDPILVKVLDALSGSWLQGHKHDPALQPYYPLRNELSVVDGVILRGDAVVVPRSLCNRVMGLAHEGHPGIARTKGKLKDQYWWPGMGAEVERFVSRCQACQNTDKTAKPGKPYLQPVEVPTDPWVKVSLDIAGPFATAPHTRRFLVVLQDYTSKWPEVFSCGNITTASIVNFLDVTFQRHGYPEQLVTDNGTQLVSHDFEVYLQKHGIRHIRVSNYHPMANGLVERFNRVLGERLQTVYFEGKPWLDGLRDILVSYRSAPHAVTGMSPFEMLHGGRRMRTALTPPSVKKPLDEPRWKAHVDAYQQAYKARADVGASHINLEAGDVVRYRLPYAPKGKPKWSYPIRIQRRIGDSTFVLDDGKQWNARNLCPYRGSESGIDPEYGFDPNEPMQHAGKPYEPNEPLPPPAVEPNQRAERLYKQEEPPPPPAVQVQAAEVAEPQRRGPNRPNPTYPAVPEQRDPADRAYPRTDGRGTWTNMGREVTREDRPIHDRRHEDRPIHNRRHTEGHRDRSTHERRHTEQHRDRSTYDRRHTEYHQTDRPTHSRHQTERPTHSRRQSEQPAHSRRSTERPAHNRRHTEEHYRADYPARNRRQTEYYQAGFP